MKNLIIFGAPGAGKGTQAKKIQNQYNIIHYSTGDILRTAIKNKTKLGLKASEFMNKGEYVPDEVVIGIINKSIEKRTKLSGFIFDGFPRTVEQAKALDILMDKFNETITMAIHIDVDENILIDRLAKRASKENRLDDKNTSIIKNRIFQYKQKTIPVIDYYRQKKILKKINGNGTIDEIFNNINNIL